MKFEILLAAIAIYLALGGCDKKTEDPVTILKSADITDARLFYLLVKDTSQSATPFLDQQVLYKINASGATEEVTFQDQHGKDMTPDVHPVGIFKVNETYVIMAFKNGNFYEAYIVSVASGIMKKLDNHYPSLLSWGNSSLWSQNQWVVQKDAANNCYIAGPEGIVKISLSDLSITSLADKFDPLPPHFAVNSAGVLGYEGKLRLTSGDYYAFENPAVGTGSTRPSVIRGIAEEFIFVSGGYVFSANVEGSGVIESSLDPEDYVKSGIFHYHRLTSIDKVVILQNENYPEYTLYDTDTANCIKRYDMIETGQALRILNMTSNERYVYMSILNMQMMPEIVRVDFAGPEPAFETVMPADQYVALMLSVNIQNEITFFGVQISDSTGMMAQIDVNGNVSKLGEASWYPLCLMYVE